MQLKKSLKFALLIIGVFVGVVNSEAQILLPMGSTWKYLDNGTDQGTTWKDVVFNDTPWASGPAELGYSVGTVSTTLGYGPDANNKYITTYFRTQFNITDLNQIGDYLKIVLKRDDGAVIYINGVEVLRSNMPTGTITYTTIASSNNLATETRLIPKTALVQGNNVIAVSIHQTGVTSSDIWFDMSIENVLDQFVIGSGKSWKYLDNGTDQGTAWTALSYDDTPWQSSLAPLGYSMTGVLSTVSFGSDANNKYRTTYYRKTVNVNAADLTNYDSLLVTLRIDDGAILYINGTEVMRKNIPTGTITYTTLATSPAVGSAPAVFTAMLPMNVLTAGNNIFAVEIHQQAATSSDTYFDMSIDPIKNDSVIVNSGASWKYNDQGTTAPSGWGDITFNDATWLSGNAALGYGNGNEVTTVSYGANAANKHMTTYFRKKFNLTTTTGYANLQLNLKRDDGAVVYVNGIDVYRSNMLAGMVNYTTTAISPIEGADEDMWITINLPASLLVNGDNMIAVEIHKFNSTETDLSFDLKASLQQTPKLQTPATTIINCNPNESNTIGCFTSVKPSAQTPGFVIPPTHTFQLIAKQGAASGFYKNSTRTMPTNHDFTAYLGTNGSSKNGIISINHETDPADVSLVSVHLNDTTKTWVVDSARLVDFTPLVKSVRHCSGGITPWGTVVVSEESYATSDPDANSDGYKDKGWNAEIDPVSGKVVNQDGIGGPDKLWAMGRMNHENVCISADSSIVYEGEDGGTHGVYKFVMTVKGKLDAGTLYVLKRDAPTSTTGTWVQVPNTTQAERNSVSTAITALGGTNWNGVEDVEFGPDGKMYFTSKGTGTIWRFKDDGITVSQIEAWVTNTSYPITHSEGVSNESFSTGIDNLAFDNEGNLWAQQDGGRGHLWVIRPDHTPLAPHVELFAVTPTGSESTGLTFSPDFKYGFMSIQHPTGTATIVDAAGNNVVFNAGLTIVFARKENLGAGAVKPTFALADSLTGCGSIVVTGNTTPGVLNVWKDNSTNNTLTVTQTGWYNVTAYANNGQTYTDSVYVKINPLPIVSLGADVTQCGGTVTLDAGNVGSTYVWSSTETTQTITASATGSYSVIVTDANNCSASASKMITINQLPIVSLGADVTQCGGTVTLNAGNAGSTFVWSSTETTQTITASSTGIYSVIVTDGNNCTGSGSKMITINPLPTVSLGADVTQCGGTIILDAGNAGSTYTWSSTETTQTITASATGTYSVIVTDANNCTGSDSKMITINTLPTVSLGADVTQCGGTVILDAGNTGLTYAWSSAETTQTITASATGTYSVVVTDANNCTGSDSKMITINPLPTVSLGADVTQCGGTVTLNAGNAGSIYTWSSTETTQTITASATGTYSVVVTDVNNCSNSDVLNVTINQLPNIATSLTGLVITANQNGATYQWVNCNTAYSAISGETNQSYTATANGSYAVIVTMNNCSDTSACQNILSTGIAQIINNNQLVIYPNPNNGVFTIQSTSEGAYEIMNELGQTIQSIKLTPANKHTMIIENLTNGVYFIVGSNNNSIIRQKIIVVK